MPYPLPRRPAGAGLFALALSLLAAVPVRAADLAYPPYPGPEEAPPPVYREAPPAYHEEPLGPPPPPPLRRPRFTAGPPIEPGLIGPGEACRVVVRRRLDEDGEEIVRRIRICDEPAFPHGPRPSPSFYRAPPPPLPPGEVPDPRWGGPRW